MNVIEKFETCDVQPEKCLDYWNELSNRRYAGSYVDARDPDFHGRMWFWTIGELAMLRPQTHACRVGREPVPANPARVILHLQCRGSGRYRQAGNIVDLQPGDFVLCSSHERYSIELSAHETLAIEFPSQPLMERFPELASYLVTGIRGTSPSVRILHDFLLSLWRQGYREVHHARWEEEVSAIFFDMTAMALRGAEFAYRDASARAQIGLIHSVVDARLQDPELDSAALALEANLSVRTLQKLFARMGTTPSAYILNKRLELAAERLLATPEASITEIAFEHGFNDSGYFTRCFRRHFGSSPSIWRLRQ